MPNTIQANFGSAASAWTIYADVFATGSAPSPTALSGTVSNGTAFVSDSFANRNAGAILLTNVGGLVSGNLPSHITDTGIYPVIIYKKLTGSYDSQNDQPLSYTYGSVQCAVLFSGTLKIASARGYLATSLSPTYGTVYNQAILVPESDSQIILFSPKSSTEYENVSGWTWEFRLNDTESLNTTTTVITPVVVDQTIPIIQVTLPAGITTLRGYALVCTSPQLRTVAQGTILVRETASIG